MTTPLQDALLEELPEASKQWIAVIDEGSDTPGLGINFASGVAKIIYAANNGVAIALDHDECVAIKDFLEVAVEIGLDLDD